MKLVRERLTGAALLLSCTLAVRCSKEAAEKTAPVASASGPLAAASASASAAPAAANVNAPAAWSGSYVAKVGPVAPPDNAKEKTWADDPGTAAVGRGTVTLSVSGPGGETVGDLSGPLGDLKVSGVFDGKELRATLAPKDPKADGAMTGFMLLTSSGEPPTALTGTLRVANRDARIVREATVEVAKK